MFALVCTQQSFLFLWTFSTLWRIIQFMSTVCVIYLDLFLPAGKSSVELAVTGSGLPVSLVPSPCPRFRFPPCVRGERCSLLCTLRNICTKLPVVFRFRKLPHFSTEPSSGTIQQGQCQVPVLKMLLDEFTNVKTQAVTSDLFYSN